MAPPNDDASFVTYRTLSEYNNAFPDAAMPANINARNALRSFTCAGAGLEDDLAGGDATYTLDFLPGGSPEPGEPDRPGNVVASRWGNAPYLVFAEHVSLRLSWETVTGLWPAELSTAGKALRSLPTT